MWKNMNIPSQVIDQNIEHYQKSMQKIQTSGKTFAPAWNWSACFLTLYWLVYRRCYKWAAITYVGTIVASGILGFILGLIGLGFLAGFVPIAIMVAFGLFGDSLYFYAIKEKIYKLKQAGKSDEEILSKTRPSWIPALILFGIIMGISLICVIGIVLFGVGLAALFSGFGTYSEYAMLATTLPVLFA